MKKFNNQSYGSHADHMNYGGAKFCRFALFPLMLLMLLLLPAGMVAQKAASSSKYIATYESSTQTLTFKEYAGETLPEKSAWVEDKQTVATINKKLGKGTIVHIVFDKSFSTYTPTTLYGFFKDLTKLETITGLEYLNTEKVTDMRSMFSNCSSLTSLDVTHFNTANVTNMGYMFYSCSSLTSLDVTHFNTAKVTDMSRMFYNCSSLTSLDVTYFNTEEVRNMSNMFDSCSSLTSLDVTHFNTANVTDMHYMFSNCVALTSLYLTNFNTEKVTYMYGMFSSCSSLTTIYASSKFVTTQVSNSSGMFYNCEKLKGEEEWTNDKATDKTFAKIEGGYFSGGIPRVKYADGTLTFFLTSKETLGENEYGIYGLGAKPDWVWKNPNVTKVTKVVFDPAFANARPTNCYAWFQGYVNLTSIEGIEYLNTSQVTDMHNMFYNCYHLQTTDFSGFDTRKVKDMSYMFHNCGSLKSLDISNFNTSEVTDMRGMFDGCIGLTSLDLSHLNTSKVSVMASMFQSCINLLSVNLSGWDTRNVINMTRMFKRCHSLKTLDLSGFDTREKTCTMGDMFNTCKELTTIFVSDKFAVGTGDTGDGTMFQGCNKLKGANALDKNNPQTGIDNANYKTGYFTKLVGKNGDEKIGATGEILTAENLTLNDDKDFVAYEPFAAKAASYSRTMNAGTTWATLCLPFEVSLENQNFRAFKLLSADDVSETVELEEIETSIAAGTPVIIKMNDGETKLNFTVADKDIANEVKTAETASGNYQLQGLYTQKLFSKDTDNNCYIVKGDKLMNPAKLLGETTTEFVGSKPFRAYMVDNSSAPAAGARMFSISVGGSTTAIEQLESTADSKAEYYDLQGRRLQDLQKGINIVKRGGKTMKVIIK